MKHDPGGKNPNRENGEDIVTIDVAVHNTEHDSILPSLTIVGICNNIGHNHVCYLGRSNNHVLD